ncbi:MAG: hypothetical protein WCD27_06135 [Candidatus Acidiferrales bacterium]
MTNFVFRYNTDLVNPPTQAFPKRTITHRPRIAVVLAAGTVIFSCYALVDSGADDCIFPTSFGTQLGLNVPTGKQYPFGGAGGGAIQMAYFFDLQLAIPQVGKYSIPIGFTDALESVGLGLLGQNGFFDRFRVSFNLKKGIFTLSR